MLLIFFQKHFVSVAKVSLFSPDGKRDGESMLTRFQDRAEALVALPISNTPKLLFSDFSVSQPSTQAFSSHSLDSTWYEMS